MGPRLIVLIILASAGACVATEVLLFRMFEPPDASAAVLAGAWVAMPYLIAVGLALLARRHPAALITLLVTVVLVGAVGISMFDATAAGYVEARRQAETAVLPGEDPDHGPAGMRKAGADLGVAVTGAFSIVVVLVVPPCQLGAVALAGGLALLISVVVRRREAEAGPGE